MIGLPLTILASVFILALIAFGDVTEDVVTADPIVALDTHVDAVLASHRQPLATSLMLWLTLLGKGQVVTVMAFAACALFLLWNCRYYVVPLVLTLGGAEATMQLVKRAVGRARPGADLAYYVERSFSFPSGHATMAAAFYGFLAYAVVSSGLARGWRTGIACTLLMVIAGIGLSRMYLGVHFLSDVLGGYLVGLMWVAIGIVVAEVMRARSAAAPIVRQLALPLKITVSIALIVAATAFYVTVGWHYAPLTGEPSALPMPPCLSLPSRLSRYPNPRHRPIQERISELV